MITVGIGVRSIRTPHVRECAARIGDYVCRSFDPRIVDTNELSDSIKRRGCLTRGSIFPTCLEGFTRSQVDTRAVTNRMHSDSFKLP